MTTSTSSRRWRNAIVLVAAIVAVTFTGFASATVADSSSCAAVLCPTPSTCEAGKCKLICPAGQADCNGVFSDGCETNLLAGDVANCGKCNRRCPEPKPYEFVSCENGRCKYTDRCVAIKCATYPNSSTTCSKGKCRVTCNAGYADCNGKLDIGSDGCEVNLLSDAENCGSCGLKCVKPRNLGKPTCSKGVCRY